MNRLSIVPAALSLVVGLAACADENTEPMPSDGQPDDQAIYTDNTDEAGPVGRGDVENIGLINMAGSRCSGVLISARTALTATHCEPVVGEEIVYADARYTISAVNQPPAELATKWGPYDVTVVTLSRDVVYPGTKVKYEPYSFVASRKIKKIRPSSAMAPDPMPS
ncbi:MAG: hypothetical protein RLZZ450_3698 [Pseudomonadota bacterium]|jgi:hypothetical protein